MCVRGTRGAAGASGVAVGGGDKSAGSVATARTFACAAHGGNGGGGAPCAAGRATSIATDNFHFATDDHQLHADSWNPCPVRHFHAPLPHSANVTGDRSVESASRTVNENESRSVSWRCSAMLNVGSASMSAVSKSGMLRCAGETWSGSD